MGQTYDAKRDAASIRKGLANRAAVEIMPQGDKNDPEDRDHRLGAIVRQGEGTKHHAETQSANPRWHGIAVRQNAAAKADRAKQDRQEQPHFMEKRIDQSAPDGGEHREEHRRGHAMGDAQPRQDNRPSVKTFPCRS